MNFGVILAVTAAGWCLYEGGGTYTIRHQDERQAYRIGAATRMHAVIAGDLEAGRIEDETINRIGAALAAAHLERSLARA